MIRTETIENFIKTWSDSGKMIHGGLPEADYMQAYDPIDNVRSYVEVDFPKDAEADSSDFINALENLGVNLNEEE